MEKSGTNGKVRSSGGIVSICAVPDEAIEQQVVLRVTSLKFSKDVNSKEKAKL